MHFVACFKDVFRSPCPFTWYKHALYCVGLLLHCVVTSPPGSLRQQSFTLISTCRPFNDRCCGLSHVSSAYNMQMLCCRGLALPLVIYLGQCTCEHIYETTFYWNQTPGWGCVCVVCWEEHELIKVFQMMIYCWPVSSSTSWGEILLLFQFHLSRSHVSSKTIKRIPNSLAEYWLPKKVMKGWKEGHTFT